MLTMITMLPAVQIAQRASGNECYRVDVQAHVSGERTCDHGSQERPMAFVIRLKRGNIRCSAGRSTE
jgi:hypothetical protein